MTLTTTPQQLSRVARAMLLVMAGGGAIVAAHLGDPDWHLWLDNGQVWAFYVSSGFCVGLAIWPWRQRLAFVAGVVTLGTTIWRLITAVVEVVRDNGPGDWLRVGTYMLLTSAMWIAWTSIWLIVNIGARVRTKGIS